MKIILSKKAGIPSVGDFSIGQFFALVSNPRDVYRMMEQSDPPSKNYRIMEMSSGRIVYRKSNDPAILLKMTLIEESELERLRHSYKIDAVENLISSAEGLIKCDVAGELVTVGKEDLHSLRNALNGIKKL